MAVLDRFFCTLNSIYHSECNRTRLKIKATTFFICGIKTIKVFQSSRQECVINNWFSYFSTKTYVVGTQKNRLDETVLLSTPKHM